VVSLAKKPPPWLTAEQIENAVRAECLPPLLAQRGLAPATRPDVERDLIRRALAAAGPTTRVKLDPSITVFLSNGVRFSARVVKYGPPVAGEAMSGRDLALLRIEAADMPSPPLADSGAAKIGDPLHILGFPGVVLTHELLNASAKMEASLTNGAISGFKQDVSGEPVIQTDARAAWSNGGSPAVDDGGRVVGVLTFVTLESGGASCRDSTSSSHPRPSGTS
jgi:S1-C subfamily serine protease